MSKKILILLFAFIIYSRVNAQEQFIIYNNDAERLALKSTNSPADCIKAALLADVSSDEANKIISNLDNALKALGQELGNIQQADKRLKAITNKLKAVFLKNYDNSATFSSMLVNGNYRDVGASVLYAYALEQYKIPYQIKETQTYIYVAAYPETYNITLETTDPQKEYITVTDQGKQIIVNLLVKLKYVDEDDVNKIGVQQAYNDFFYKESMALSLKDATGFLYYNKAAENLDAEKYERAYSNILKAQILYPAKRVEFLRKIILNDLIGTLKFNDLRDWVAIANATTYPGFDDKAKEYLKNQFDNLVQNKLWKEGRKETVDQVYNLLALSLKDTILRNDLDKVYYAEVGRYNIVANNYVEGLDYLSKAIAKNPNNVIVKSMIINVIGQKLLNQSIGSMNNISILDKYSKQFSFFAADPTVHSSYIYNYAYLSYYAFEKEDKVNGEKYLQLMRTKLDNAKPEVIKNEQQIGNVFGKASEYYYRTQGKQKAMQILNAGIKYAPNNETLARKIKVLVDSNKKH
jgi:hypothetical protein